MKLRLVANDNKYFAALFSIALLTVFSGGLIYVAWRPTPVLFLGWLNMFGLNRILQEVREYTLPMYNTLPAWVIYSLPNGLWAFSYTVIISGIWWKRKGPERIFWLCSIPALGLGYEALQYIKLVPGTFCSTDLLLAFFGIILGFILVFINYRKGGFEKWGRITG